MQPKMVLNSDSSILSLQVCATKPSLLFNLGEITLPLRVSLLPIFIKGHTMSKGNARVYTRFKAKKKKRFKATLNSASGLIPK